MDEKIENSSGKKIMSPCDVEALKKCLEENKGDYVKCQSQIEAFKSSCSLKKPNPSLESKPTIRTVKMQGEVKFSVPKQNPVRQWEVAIFLVKDLGGHASSTRFKYLNIRQIC